MSQADISLVNSHRRLASLARLISASHTLAPPARKEVREALREADKVAREQKALMHDAAIAGGMA